MLSLAVVSARAGVIAGLVGALLPFGWWAVMQLWRGRVRYGARNPWSRDRQQATYRAMPAAMVTVTLFEVAVLIHLIGGADSAGGEAPIVAAVVIGLLSFLVACCAYCWRRPRWAIPPVLRDPPPDS